LLIKPKDYLQFLKKIRRVKSKIKIEFPTQQKERKWFAPAGEFGCHCGTEVCWITQTGDFYPCIFLGKNYIVGNIRTEKLLSLWEKGKKMIRAKGNEICLNCSNLENCRGGCRARALWEYGNINAIDPLCPLGKQILCEHHFKY